MAAAAAARGVFVGTSSWKYQGWCGFLYDEQRYLYRGKFAESRFNRDCLEEYASVLPTVCVDGAYYQFPREKALLEMASMTPAGFQFSLKVTDEITIKRFPKLPRFGARAGQENPNFLDAQLFAHSFLRPCEAIRSRVGVLLFEFSKFYPTDFEAGRGFVEKLDNFLDRLPADWRYGVEIRNRDFLDEEYFSLLARHNVAHVFNSWTEMPSVVEQWEMPGSRTANHCAARFLLKPGRSYEEAVRQFTPYREAQEVYPQGRDAGAAIITSSLQENRRGTFLYVNNRLEGNALVTLHAMLSKAGL